MAEQNTKPPIPLIILLLSSFVLQAKSAPNQNLVETTCKKHKDYNFCISVFKGRSNGALPKELAKIPLEIAFEDLVATRKKIDGLVAKATEKNEKTRISTCKIDHRNALWDIHHAITELDDAPGEALTSIKNSINSINNCEDYYTKMLKTSAPCPVSQENKKLLKLFDIARIIVEGI